MKLTLTNPKLRDDGTVMRKRRLSLDGFAANITTDFQSLAAPAFLLLSLLLLSLLLPTSSATPFIVQQLSSSYAIVLGGYGPGYTEMRQIDVVKHNKVCNQSISDIPSDPRRYLGDKTGMAEYINGTSVLFCRHAQCWQLRMGPNTWTQVDGFHSVRDRAASAQVADTMIVLGGRGVDENDLVTFEEFDLRTASWVERPEWEMAKGRFSFCAVPLNLTSLLVVGGFSSTSGALSSVELLDVESGSWQTLPDLPEPRYGHACLMMEWAGRPGILVSGGALTGRDVLFYDINLQSWVDFESLPFHTDGHKMVLVEGIPTVFAWERVVQFNGKQWVDAPDLKLTNSRSAFAVTTVPGHLVPNCI